MNRVKMIYIDPPYNTGNDFVYKDDFADCIENYKKIIGATAKSNAETAGRYHTNWLNMMLPRLKLARVLLKPDGVIFISIDDNEITNLRKLCDEVFGEYNFLGILPRVTKKAGKTTDAIASNHDYILIYSKSESVRFNLQSHTDEGFKFEDEFVESRGKYKLNQTLDYDSLQYSPSLDYPIEINGKTLYPGNSLEKYNARKSGQYSRADWAWRWSKELFEFGLKNGFIVVKEYDGYSRIYTKTYQNASIERITNGFEIRYIERTKPLLSLEFVENAYSNDNAKKNLISLFEVAPFDYAKPISLLKFLIAFSTTNDDIVLDFFSGSGTTAHAVMQLNAEDGGKRKFICVQMPELTDGNSEAYKAGYKNLCEIGKERIRRAGEKIKNFLLENGDIYRYYQKHGTPELQDITVGKAKLLDDGRDMIINGKTHTVKKAIAYWGDDEKNKEMSENLDTGFKVFKLDASNLRKWDNSYTRDYEALAQRVFAYYDYLLPDRKPLDLVYEIMLKYSLPLTLPVEEVTAANAAAHIITHAGDENMDAYKVLICMQPDLTIEQMEALSAVGAGTLFFADMCFTDTNAMTNCDEILKKAGQEMRLF
ncbi:MAG: site-specific DNA-methyltransferase [Clostridiales bacterium]|nr:site-specific DNA-methyltransferase [Clostridiales bacterium]